MKLEPVYADESAGSVSRIIVPGTIAVSPDKQQMLGIATTVVSDGPLANRIRTTGRVLADDTRLYRVTAGSEGWVRKIYPAATGAFVRKDELLAVYFARDFAAAQQSYLYALKNRDAVSSAPQSGGGGVSGQAQVESAVNNLLALGISDIQISELARSRTSATEIELRAPVSGFLIQNNVFAGLRFERGMELIRIADLSHVWIAADVFGAESEYLAPGTTVKISVAGQKRQFTARVSPALPLFDEGSRTLKVRLEADNPRFLLRPGMFVDVQFAASVASATSVPAEAVLNSGLDERVFVQRSDGRFEARSVVTGRHVGDRIEILDGLSRGERVVTSSTFLLDSEARLRAEALPKEAATALLVDPVCGMEIDSSSYRSTVRGTEYHFCSADCKRNFDKNPGTYMHARRTP
jgi:membrane fusion protein, copper/silver efflux system